MEITLQYVDDCPNWKITDAHLTALINDHGIDATLHHQLIDTPDAAAEHGFRGSPTVLIDGIDPFADPDAPVGLGAGSTEQTAEPPDPPPSANSEKPWQHAERERETVVTVINRLELLHLLEEEEAQIVDVLPEPEYAGSHIPGAINIPLKRLTADTASVLRSDKSVVVY